MCLQTHFFSSEVCLDGRMTDLVDCYSLSQAFAVQLGGGYSSEQDQAYVHKKKPGWK